MAEPTPPPTAAPEDPPVVSVAPATVAPEAVATPEVVAPVAAAPLAAVPLAAAPLAAAPLAAAPAVPAGTLLSFFSVSGFCLLVSAQQGPVVG